YLIAYLLSTREKHITFKEKLEATKEELASKQKLEPEREQQEKDLASKQKLELEREHKKLSNTTLHIYNHICLAFTCPHCDVITDNLAVYKRRGLLIDHALLPTSITKYHQISGVGVCSTSISSSTHTSTPDITSKKKNRSNKDKIFIFISTDWPIFGGPRHAGLEAKLVYLYYITVTLQTIAGLKMWKSGIWMKAHYDQYKLNQISDKIF
ncbi:hypothetical protein ACJX0J_039756, partial [Zea mays]